MVSKSFGISFEEPGVPSADKTTFRPGRLHVDNSFFFAVVKAMSEGDPHIRRAIINLKALLRHKNKIDILHSPEGLRTVLCWAVSHSNVATHFGVSDPVNFCSRVMDPSRYQGDQFAIRILGFYLSMDFIIVSEKGVDLTFVLGKKKALFLHLNPDGYYSVIHFKTPETPERCIVETDEVRPFASLFNK
jgi:hypothetical protein